MAIQIRRPDRWRTPQPQYRPVSPMRLNLVVALLCFVLLLIGFLRVVQRRYRPARPERFPALVGLKKLERCRERYRMLCERHAFPDAIPEAHFVIVKPKRLLLLFSGTELLEKYTIRLGRDPETMKTAHGDGATPLGDYYISSRVSDTDLYLFLGISYPNAEDAERAFRLGRISREAFDRIRTAISARRAPPEDTSLGGGIGIHGVPDRSDRTDGSIALPQEAIEEIWYVARIGTPVSIQQ
jgi:hypothetical protein